MRQNLTNVKETQLDKVDSFYIVGSTTKEGLIEGRSNVKIDLKKAVAEGGGGGGEQSFDAKKFGDDVVKQLYDSDLESLVFPDLYLTVRNGNPVSITSAEMFAASILGHFGIIPLYASIPDSDNEVITKAFTTEIVSECDSMQGTIDGETYYSFNKKIS